MSAFKLFSDPISISPNLTTERWANRASFIPSIEQVLSHEYGSRSLTLATRNGRRGHIEKDKMTWLFMGDSITHAALWTKGYDGIAQTFEKYLKDEMGRASDTVINTAVSGATTTSTLNEHRR